MRCGIQQTCTNKGYLVMGKLKPMDEETLKRLQGRAWVFSYRKPVSSPVNSREPESDSPEADQEITENEAES